MKHLTLIIIASLSFGLQSVRLAAATAPIWERLATGMTTLSVANARQRLQNALARVGKPQRIRSGIIPEDRTETLDRFVRQWLVSLLLENGPLDLPDANADLGRVIRHITPRTFSILLLLDRQLPDSLDLGALLAGAKQGLGRDSRILNTTSNLPDDVSATFTQTERQVIAAVADAIVEKFRHGARGKDFRESPARLTLKNNDEHILTKSEYPTWCSKSCSDIAERGRRILFSGTEYEQNFMKLLAYLACGQFFYVFNHKYACQKVLNLPIDNADPCGRYRKTGIGTATYTGEQLRKFLTVK